VLHDIGCASFWYAATLQIFFRPDRMVGVEVEGHRMFRDGRARIDYAAGYLAELRPRGSWSRTTQQPKSLPTSFTAWFPFLTPAAILAWRLPLTLLAPERLFRQIRHNLRADGLYFMVNHGLQEAESAKSLVHRSRAEVRGALVGTGDAEQASNAASGTLLVEARLDKIFVFISKLLYHPRRLVNFYLVRFWSPRRSRRHLTTTHKAGFFDPGGRHAALASQGNA